MQGAGIFIGVFANAQVYLQEHLHLIAYAENPNVCLRESYFWLENSVIDSESTFQITSKNRKNRYRLVVAMVTFLTLSLDWDYLSCFKAIIKLHSIIIFLNKILSISQSSGLSASIRQLDRSYQIFCSSNAWVR